MLFRSLTKAIGKKPVGYRAPSWQFSPWTMKQVKDAGFLYDSSLMASDDAYEILLDKQPSGVIELPIERILDDFPYFGGATNGGMPNPDLIEQVFRSEFDVAYEEGGLYILTMHPHITGHRSRVAGLEKTDSAHEVEAGRVVRDARADCAIREDAAGIVTGDSGTRGLGDLGTWGLGDYLLFSSQRAYARMLRRP